jgi:hypothetical protein
MLRCISSRAFRAFALVASVLASSGTAASPYQFIAKQYSEGLGRSPDAGAWRSSVSYFANNGCSQRTLKDAATQVFVSAEYASRDYDNFEKVLTVYRALFSREPDPSGFTYWVNFLNNGNSMASMIDFMLQGLDGGRPSTATICASLGYGWDRNYAPLPNTVIPAKNDGGLKTLAELQAALANAQPGSTVYLAQRAVISTPVQLVVKPGVTLATVGLPPRSQYAKQARIVRTAKHGDGYDYYGALIRVESGGKLDSIWISGQAQSLGYANGSVNVALAGGQGTSIVNSRLDNSTGWASIVAHHYGSNCNAMLIYNNLVTGYSNSHHYEEENIDGAPAGYTDGISGNCEGFTASYNNVIDASDVGIIALSSGSGKAQHSQILNNTVISAGVPSFGALMLATLPVKLVGAQGSFAGARINNNVFWAAPDSHIDIGLVLGGLSWDPEASVGIGGEASGNSNEGIASPMYIGWQVDGMLQATVQYNTISRTTPRASYPDHPKRYTSSCLNGDALVDLNPAAGHASGSAMQGGTQNAATHGCIRHNAPQP